MLRVKGHGRLLVTPAKLHYCEQSQLHVRRQYSSFLPTRVEASSTTRHVGKIRIVELRSMLCKALMITQLSGVRSWPRNYLELRLRNTVSISDVIAVACKEVLKIWRGQVNHRARVTNGVDA